MTFLTFKALKSARGDNYVKPRVWAENDTQDRASGCFFLYRSFSASTQTTMVYHLVFYVDGGCRLNGRRDAYGAAAAVKINKFGKAMTWRRQLPRAMERFTTVPTNQRAELTAVIMALEISPETQRSLATDPDVEVNIYTDSAYAIGCLTQWLRKWEANGWTNAAGTSVSNRDLIEEANGLVKRLRRVSCNVSFYHISRSQNALADEACNDELDEMEG